jgi:hypothetical protein
LLEVMAEQHTRLPVVDRVSVDRGRRPTVHGTAEGAMDAARAALRPGSAGKRRAHLPAARRSTPGRYPTTLPVEHDARARPLGQDRDRVGHFQPPFLGHLHPPLTPRLPSERTFSKWGPGGWFQSPISFYPPLC